MPWSKLPVANPFGATHPLGARSAGSAWTIMLVLSLLFAHGAMLIWLSNKAYAGLVPGATSLGILREGQLWTLFSHAWVHQDSLHLSMNMLLIFVAGKMVETQIGGGKMMSLFLVGAVGGALLQLPLGRVQDAAIVGASGGLFSLIGAAGVIYGREPLFHFRQLNLRLSHINLAIGLIASNVLLELLSRFTFPTMPSLHGVAWLDHLGGGVLGMALATLFYQKQGTSKESAAHIPLPNDLPAEEYVPLLTLREAAAQEGEEWKLASETGPHRIGMTLEERIDRILDRLSRVGMNGLTDKEKALLKEASERLGKGEQLHATSAVKPK